MRRIYRRGAYSANKYGFLHNRMACNVGVASAVSDRMPRQGDDNDCIVTTTNNCKEQALTMAEGHLGQVFCATPIRKSAMKIRSRETPMVPRRPHIPSRKDAATMLSKFLVARLVDLCIYQDICIHGYPVIPCAVIKNRTCAH